MGHVNLTNDLNLVAIYPNHGFMTEERELETREEALLGYTVKHNYRLRQDSERNNEHALSRKK